MSRFHLAALALRHSPRLPERASTLIEECDRSIEAAVRYTREHLEDPPEIRDWTWTTA